jgi:hypothetical protein
MSLIVSDHNKRWPGGCLVWKFHSGLSDDEQGLLSDAMAHWADRANVRFIERTTQHSYVLFKPDEDLDGVSNSRVGMQGGEQVLRMEPLTVAGEVTARHEIGHALGLKHEHLRCDRDDFVTVSGKLKEGRKGDYQPKLCGGDFEDVGAYDFASIMHYNKNSADTTDGSDALTGADDAKQALLDNTARRRVSAGDKAGIAKLHGGNAHVYQLSHDGQIEKTVRQYSWSNGWTIATHVNLDVRNYMFLLKASNGTMHYHNLNTDGSIGTREDKRDWSSGWTAAIKYAIGPSNYMLLYKRGDGRVHIHDIDLGGKIGGMKFNIRIEDGWTTIRHYAVGTSNFLIFYNAATGDTRVRSIDWRGNISDGPQAFTGQTGWTCVEPYSSGGNNYLFRLKAGSGAMNIRRIRGDGSIGSDNIDARDWSGGWTRAIPYDILGSAYLLLLKEGTGRLDIRRLNSDGTIGATTDRREFEPGWTVGEVYQILAGTFLIMIKTG